MRPVYVTVSAPGTSAWVPMDAAQNPFNASVGCTITGSPTYGVEYTYDDIFDAAVTPVAWPLAAIPAGTLVNKDAQLVAPVRAVRLNVTVAAGASVKMAVLQGLGQ